MFLFVVRAARITCIGVDVIVVIGNRRIYQIWLGRVPFNGDWLRIQTLPNNALRFAYVNLFIVNVNDIADMRILLKLIGILGVLKHVAYIVRNCFRAVLNRICRNNMSFSRRDGIFVTFN